MKKKRVILPAEKVRSVIDNGTPCTSRELDEVMDELVSSSEDLPRWLVIVLKTLFYLLGLILAGVGSVTAASCMLYILNFVI